MLSIVLQQIGSVRVQMFRKILLFCLVLFVSACADEAPQEQLRLKVGILPDKSIEVLRDEFQPLIDHLAAETSMPVELVIPESYEQLLDLFVNNEVDLAFFGGLTFLQAQAKSGAVPLVTRDVDARFTSIFLARQGESGSKVTDFTGRHFGFGSELSTSGHLMPRYYMQSLGVDPEKFFSGVTYTGAHDNTAHAVADGTVDLGVANALVVRRMLSSGALDTDKVKIIWETPPYTDYVWAIQSDVNGAVKEDILEAFLSLSMAKAPDRVILDKQNARSFLPVRQEDFSKLRELAKELELL